MEGIDKTAAKHFRVEICYAGARILRFLVYLRADK